MASHKAWLQKAWNFGEAATAFQRELLNVGMVRDSKMSAKRYESFVERVLKADHEHLGKSVKNKILIFLRQKCLRRFE